MKYPYLIAVACAASAHAQPAASANQDIVIADRRIDTIEIVGRTGTSADQVGSAYSRVPLLADLPTTASSDLLKLTPGLSVSRQGPVGSLTQVRVRGSEANQTLVFVDGVEANDPAVGEYDFSGLTALGQSRIEILRGPQSALWGTEAIGGVVNLVTRIPDGAFAQGEGGSQASFSAGGGYGLSGPAGDIGALIHYQRTGGVSVARNGVEKDGFQGLTVLIKATTDISADITLSGSARYQSNRVAFDDFVGGTIAPLADANLVTRSDRLYLHAAAQWRLADIALTNRITARYVDTRNRNDRDTITDSTTYGSRFIVGYQGSYDFSIGSIHSTLTAAAEYRRETFRNNTPQVSPFFDPNQTQHRRQTSVIAEYKGQSDQTSVSASLRHDDNSGFRSANTWRLTARQQLGLLALRGSYGTAITNPTFYEQFGFAPKTFIGNARIKPERGAGWDIGLEYGDWLKLTYFNTRLTDEIITVFTPSFQSTVENAATRSKRQGVEIEGHYAIGGIDLFATYTWTRSTQPDVVNPAVQVKELRRPAHTASIAANWTGLADTLTVAGALSYQGSNTDTAFDAFFNAVPVTLPAYIQATASVSYRIAPQATLFARVENIFNSRAEDVFGYAQPGIAAFVGVKVTFGP